MERGPARETEYYSDDGEDRDPVDTLNYKELLNVCGTATNAFVNLASAGGIEARRLLLLDAQGMNTNHVVAEVLLDGRWVIVDPTFHAILKDSAGRLLTKQELARPAVFQDATRNIAGYDPAYNYEHTAFIHIASLPLVGRFLQTHLNSILPSWQERINWALVVERQSNATIIAGFVLFCFAICLRRFIFRYRAETFFPSGESLGTINARRCCVVFRISASANRRETFPLREVRRRHRRVATLFEGMFLQRHLIFRLRS